MHMSRWSPAEKRLALMQAVDMDPMHSSRVLVQQRQTREIAFELLEEGRMAEGELAQYYFVVEHSSS